MLWLKVLHTNMVSMLMPLFLKKIPGLAQLERTNYVIAKDEQDRLVEAYGSKYSMGVANYGSNMVVDTFFFKENNHYDGKDFYAIRRI